MNYKKFSLNLRKKFYTETYFNLGNVVLCCSGGVDSIVLLELTQKLLENKKISSLRVLYFNHKQRSKNEINKDIECIQKNLKPGLKFEVIELNLPLKSSESSMRSARINFLTRNVSKNELVFLAHHSDDNIETFIVKLLRGSHPSTLRGLKFKSKIQNLHLIRPLLDFTKKELVEYAKEQKLIWNEDLTNSETTFLRNSIRNEILPLLEKRRAGSKKNLIRFFKELEVKNKKKEKNVSQKKISQYKKALHSNQGLKIESLTFKTLKLVLEKIVLNENTSVNYSHWKTLKEIIKNHARNPKKTKILQFPGVFEALFLENRIFLRPKTSAHLPKEK